MSQDIRELTTATGLRAGWPWSGGCARSSARTPSSRKHCARAQAAIALRRCSTTTCHAPSPRGRGQALLDWLKAEARSLGCRSPQLDSGTQRKHAHAFYLREGLRIDAFHFGTPLD